MIKKIFPYLTFLLILLSVSHVAAEEINSTNYNDYLTLGSGNYSVTEDIYLEAEERFLINESNISIDFENNRIIGSNINSEFNSTILLNGSGENVLYNITFKNMVLENNIDSTKGIVVTFSKDFKLLDSNVHTINNSILIINSSNFKILNCNITSEENALIMSFSDDSEISGNNITSKYVSVLLFDANYCKIFENNICSNIYSICLLNSTDNHFWINNIFGDTYVKGSDNVFNSNESIFYEYCGGNYSCKLGNYWSTYKISESVSNENGILTEAHILEPEIFDEKPLSGIWDSGKIIGDLENPDIEFDLKPYYNETTVIIKGYSNDENPYAIFYTLDGQSNDSIIYFENGTFEIQLLALNEGVHEIRIYSKDISGNANDSGYKSFLIDTIYPKITLDIKSVYNESSIKITGTINESNLNYSTFVIDNRSLENIFPDEHGNFSIGVDNLDEGFHVIYINITDLADHRTEIGPLIILMDFTPPEIVIDGLNNTYEVYSEYNKPVINAIDNYDGEVPIEVSGEFDLNNVGVYTLNYSARDSAGNTAKLTSTVHVVDTTPPVITLNSNGNITLEAGSEYIEKGAIAVDNYDGNLTNNITIVSDLNSQLIGTYYLTYKVMDSNGNSANVTRTVHVVDTTPPVIALNGEENLVLNVLNDNYTEYGVKVSDNSNENLSPIISGNVDTSKVGTYILIYHAEDSSGNSAEIRRVVNVVDTKPPEITLKGDEYISLKRKSVYVEPGFNISDNYYSNDEIAVKTIGKIKTTVVGTYVMTYIVTDPSGNSNEINRTIEILPRVKK